MTRLQLALICLLLVTTAPACARTVYTHLHPQLPAPAVAPDAERWPPKGWQNFFLWGLVPGEITIDASAECGGTERIERIETRQTFVQGLIRSVAGVYGINIYAPYTARVVCDRHAQAASR